MGTHTSLVARQSGTATVEYNLAVSCKVKYTHTQQSCSQSRDSQNVVEGAWEISKAGS